MDSIYNKFIISNPSGKKDFSQPKSQLIQSNLEHFLYDENSNRKLSFCEEKIQDLKDSQQLSSKVKLFGEQYNQNIASGMKQSQTSIGYQEQQPPMKEFKLIKIEHLAQTTTQIESPNKYIAEDSPRKNKFKAIGNLVLSIRRLQQNVVHQIQNIDELKQTMQKTSTTTKISKIHPENESVQETNVNEILSNLKFIDRFIYYSEQGSDNDILKMKKLLQIYPKRHLYCPTDPKHLLNQFNKFGQNSLYISCKNGNIDVVKFLLEQQANPHIKSKVYDNYFESPLEVSLRWNHYNCVQLLLEKGNYSTAILKQSLKQANNIQMKDLIKSYLRQDTIFSCCF